MKKRKTLPLASFHASRTPRPTTDINTLKQQAQQGVVDAQVSLVVSYEKGQGVPQDYAEAAKWFRLAADQGHADAQYYLGLRYHIGQGVPQNYVEAHKWLDLASASGDEGAKRARDTVAQKNDRRTNG